MKLPKRALYTLTEVAARCGCQIADIAEWAITGRLEIMIAIPPTHFGAEILADLVVIAPGDILAMFRRCGTGPREGEIRRARALRSRMEAYRAARGRIAGHAGGSGDPRGVSGTV